MQQKRIMKFHLSLDATQTIRMPRGAEILGISGQTQDLLFILVDLPITEFEERHFKIYLNDEIIEYDGVNTKEYIGFYCKDEIYYHVFEIKEININ